MDDFDITSFRSSIYAGRGQTTQASHIASLKRKVLSLDSDSESEDEAAKSAAPPSSKKKIANVGSGSDTSSDYDDDDTTGIAANAKGKARAATDSTSPESKKDIKATALSSQLPTSRSPATLESPNSLLDLTDSPSSPAPAVSPSTSAPKRPTTTIDLDGPRYGARRLEPPPRPAPSFLDSLGDIDPDLMEMSTASPSGSPGSSSSVAIGGDGASPATEAAVIHLKLRYVHPFPMDDPGAQAILEQLSKPLKVKLRESDSFDGMLKIFSMKKRLRREELILVYNKLPVVVHATPKSLRMVAGRENQMEVYLEDEFYKMREQERQRRLERLELLRQASMDDEAPLEVPAVVEAPAEQTAEEHLHIKLRSKDNKDIGLRVKPTTTVLSMIKQYLRIVQMDESQAGNVRLKFEGEQLDPNMTVEETDLEDTDMVSVHLS
ncbi:ubiquitin-2 like Rad60 SUMO-like-domain-containing protein [Gongronella butleri]|nr:ubiquitin-2 like Rad60 SUMO-like-domain-containing protein [Gongronella butleri]